MRFQGVSGSWVGSSVVWLVDASGWVGWAAGVDASGWALVMLLDGVGSDVCPGKGSMPVCHRASSMMAKMQQVRNIRRTPLRPGCCSFFTRLPPLASFWDRLMVCFLLVRQDVRHLSVFSMFASILAGKTELFQWISLKISENHARSHSRRFWSNP